MVEDLIKRFREQAAYIRSISAPRYKNKAAEMYDHAADALQQQAGRLTALESERDALLAAAGKQAVAWLCEPNGWNGFPQLEFTTEHLSSERWKKTPLYTAPTAALEKGDGRDAWISVEERLPEVSQLVLIAFPDGGIDFSFRHNHKGNGGWSGVNPKYHTAPTHWRVPPTTPAALSQKAGEQQ